MIKFRKIGMLLALLAYLPVQASAWGLNGHRIVGEIAEFYLNAKARKAVKRILGAETLAMASNWPDFIKSDSSYQDMNSWHYVNLPEGLDRQGVFNFLESFQEANVYGKIPEMIAQLKRRDTSPAAQLMAMRVLVHLVGDLHQPMHTARKEDLGGNKVQVSWFGQRSNLHKVWDDGLLDYQQLSYTEYARAINHPTRVQFETWSHDNLQEVVLESNQICTDIYKATPADAKLSYAYNFKFIAVLNEQLLKGGIRLAGILNRIYS